MNHSKGNYRILAVMNGTELFGSERATLHALRTMKDFGAEIIVAVSNRSENGGDVGREARLMGFETFNMPFGSHFAKRLMFNDAAYRRRQIKRVFTNSRILSERIRAIQPTHIMFSTVLAFTFCCLATIQHRTPVIYRIGDKPPIESTFQMIFWRWLVRRANRVVCISKFIQKETTKVLPTALKNTTVILNAAIARPAQLDEPLVDALTQKKCTLQLTYVGQLTAQKGVQSLIEALIKLDDSNVGCWIVGGGQHTMAFESELRNMVTNAETKTAIEFCGYKADPRPFYATTDWVIVPSEYEEPLGNVVQEAADFNTPCIVTNRGGLIEVVVHKQTGYVIQGTDSDSILSTLATVRDEQKSTLEMGKASKEHIEEISGQSHFSERWLEVLKGK